MSISATVLFGTPQQEIASLIREQIARSHTARIVVGFVTVEGISLLRPVLAEHPSKLVALIVGAGTYRAYDALDQLIALGVPPSHCFVHLGHTHPTQLGATHRFYRYHPMLHSKIYYMEHPDGQASAVIGSHNMTGFALAGLNGEAAVLLDGPVDSPEFEKVRTHIDEARKYSLPYSSDMKDAFAWWTHQFMEGMSDKANDFPRDGEAKKTVVILAESDGQSRPKKDDVIYFELPKALGRISSLQAETHVFVFDKLPPSPVVALNSLQDASYSLWCNTQGLELEKGGVELRADWFIDSFSKPVLRQTRKPFRPTPMSDMQQVRAKAYWGVKGEFEYLFESPRKKWIPELSTTPVASVAVRDLRDMDGSGYSPNPEGVDWFLVTGLLPDEGRMTTEKELALRALSPEAGSYVLMSMWRRPLSEIEK